MESCSNMMALILEEIVKKTDQFCKHKLTSEKLKKHYHTNHFVSINKPKMDIKSYIHRLAKYLHVSESCFILALIYIDRLTEMHPRILVNSYTIHRLCSTSIILAMKFNDDAWFSNAYNATVCGVDKDELLFLEINFLKLIDYKLMVDPQTFKNYYNHLVEMSGYKAVLSNCSCLDPSHSYKIYSQILKCKEVNCAEEREIKTKASDSSILSTTGDCSTVKSDSSKSNNCLNFLISKENKKLNDEDSCVNINKIMEEELEVASNLVNKGQNTSFNPQHKNSVKDSTQNHAGRINSEKSHYIRKSVSNLSDTEVSGYSRAIQHSEYPTCKHRRFESQNFNNFEHHRVSF